jgi:deoxyhypusine synthase
MKHSSFAKAHLKMHDDAGERYLPHEFMYKTSGVLEEYYEIDLKDSWMYAAAEKTYQLSVQDGKIVLWEIFFASYVIKGDLKVSTIWNRMTFLADWYLKMLTGWIFQIGGGIAGDFPICVVPMLYQDMETPF